MIGPSHTYDCCSVFSGIGGFDLAAEWMGWRTVLQCENNPFSQQVLRYYWPGARLFDNIITSDFSQYEGLIDILTGGFPCQPYSLGGLRKGKGDSRHLWPFMLGAIRQIKPRWVVGENVRGLISWNDGLVFDEVQADLEAEGYQVLPFVLPACGIGAPHRRERVWFVAYSNNERGRSERSERSERRGVSQTHGKIPEWYVDAKFSHASYFSDERRPASYTDSIRRRQQLQFTGSTAPGSREELSRSSEKFITDSRGNRLQTGPRTRGGSTWSEDLSEGQSAADSAGKGLEGRGQTGGREFYTQGADLGDNGPEYLRAAITSYAAGFGLQSISWDELRSLCQTPGTPTWSVFGGGNTKDTKWADFPTQSPVCSGDDGLSSRLAGITVPKHRKESIKGYGNAVVPQLVHRIFQAIEEYEILYC